MRSKKGKLNAIYLVRNTKWKTRVNDLEIIVHRSRHGRRCQKTREIRTPRPPTVILAMEGKKKDKEIKKEEEGDVYK